ncbi:hypothetical protein CTA2_5667, partial [Colletotrichum tanaceti]
MRGSYTGLAAMALASVNARKYPFCEPDGCYRNLIDQRFEQEAKGFCVDFLHGTTVTAAAAIPTHFNNCQGDVKAVSSACSCITYGLTSTVPATTTTSCTSPTSTAVSTTEVVSKTTSTSQKQPSNSPVNLSTSSTAVSSTKDISPIPTSPTNVNYNTTTPAAEDCTGPTALSITTSTTKVYYSTTTPSTKDRATSTAVSSTNGNSATTSHQSPSVETATRLPSTTIPLANTTTRLPLTTTSSANTTTRLPLTTTPSANTTTPFVNTTTRLPSTTIPLANTTTPLANTTTPFASTTTEKPPHTSSTTTTTKLTTKTVYTTRVETVTQCPPTVINCPYRPVITTRTIAISTTVCPVAEESAKPVTTVAATKLITSTIYTTRVETITRCPPSVPDCPDRPRVITKTIAISTTVCPVTEESAKPVPTPPVINPTPLTTSTIYTTLVETITRCPPSVPDCPHRPYVTTKTIAASTTILPITERTYTTVLPVPTGEPPAPPVGT